MRPFPRPAAAAAFRIDIQGSAVNQLSNTFRPGMDAMLEILDMGHAVQTCCLHSDELKSGRSTSSSALHSTLAYGLLGLPCSRHFWLPACRAHICACAPSASTQHRSLSLRTLPSCGPCSADWSQAFLTELMTCCTPEQKTSRSQE